MANYYVVKLTKIGNNGKLNPKSIRYGLIEVLMSYNQVTRDVSISPFLHESSESAKKIGIEYFSFIEDVGDLSLVSVSFKSLCDVIPMRVRGQERGIELYKAEDLPLEQQQNFYLGMLENYRI